MIVIYIVSNKTSFSLISNISI